MRYHGGDDLEGLGNLLSRIQSQSEREHFEKQLDEANAGQPHRCCFTHAALKATGGPSNLSSSSRGTLP